MESNVNIRRLLPSIFYPIRDISKLIHTIILVIVCKNKNPRKTYVTTELSFHFMNWSDWHLIGDVFSWARQKRTLTNWRWCHTQTHTHTQSIVFACIPADKLTNIYRVCFYRHNLYVHWTQSPENYISVRTQNQILF